jgi:hypothetical protein
MTTKSYRAPWGRRIWVITGAVVVLAVALAVAMPLTISAKSPGERWAAWIAPVVVLAIVALTALWIIRRFELTDDAILVRRSFWTNRIPLASIESADLDPQACRGAWKTAGNDGLFAMHGRFRSKRLGKFQAYVTDPANAIVLRVRGDTIVISPENPRGFLRELNHRLDRLKEKR